MRAASHRDVHAMRRGARVGLRLTRVLTNDFRQRVAVLALKLVVSLRPFKVTAAAGSSTISAGSAGMTADAQAPPAETVLASARLCMQAGLPTTKVPAS